MIRAEACWASAGSLRPGATNEALLYPISHRTRGWPGQLGAEAYKRVLLAIKRRERSYLGEAVSLLNVLGIGEPEVLYVRKPSHRYYVQENVVERMARDGSKPDLVVVYDRLKPWQFYNLSKSLGCEVWDLVMLLLKIFEIHAGSREAKLKIELVRARHVIPLVKEYVRMTKLGEQAGFMGPGAYGYESLLRSLRRREVRISRELEAIKRSRDLMALSRSRRGYPHVAVIGYTCAGKTTLYNSLTGDEKPAGPAPFKTLSPKSRAAPTPCGPVIFTDTVGFIRKMPEEIVDVFHAVISEIAISDALILVVDASEPEDEIIEKIDTALEILERVGASDKPLVAALNKLDLVEDGKEHVEGLVRGALESRGWRDPQAVWISALGKANLGALLAALCSRIGITHHNAGSRFRDDGKP